MVLLRCSQDSFSSLDLSLPQVCTGRVHCNECFLRSVTACCRQISGLSFISRQVSSVVSWTCLGLLPAGCVVPTSSPRSITSTALCVLPAYHLIQVSKKGDHAPGLAPPSASGVLLHLLGSRGWHRSLIALLGTTIF